MEKTIKRSIFIKKIRVVFIIAVFISIGLSCSRTKESEVAVDNLLISQPDRIIGLGRIEPELRLLDLSSESSGIIIALTHSPGDEISEGNIIIKLTDAVERARIEQAAARLQSQLSEIKALKASLSANKIRTQNAKINYERAKFLYEKDVQTQFFLDTARTEYESLLEETNRLVATVGAAQDSVKSLQADLKLAKAELKKRYIVAPHDGRILSLDVTIGSFLQAGKSFGSFAPKSPVCARCEIDELFAEYAAPGQKAYIRYPGTTAAIAEGAVSFAGPYLRKKSLFSDDVGDLEDRRVREIVIRLNPESSILYGSRVECVIQTKQNKQDK